MSFLGYRFETGILDPKNKIAAGNWTIYWPVQDMPADADFEVWHGALLGPGGYFLVYIDDALFGVGENGNINEYGPRGKPMYVRKGQAISMHFSVATPGTAPKAWLWLQTPSQL